MEILLPILTEVIPGNIYTSFAYQILRRNPGKLLLIIM